MSSELLQGIIEIVFKGNLLYLSPILFILMIVLFSDYIVDLLHTALNTKSERRRY